MEWMFADGAQPVLGVAGATLAGLLGVGALVLRRRADRFEGTVVAVFLGDAAIVLGSLAATVGVVSAGLALGVEGVGRPLWLLVALIGAGVAGSLLVWRWRGELRRQASAYRRVTPTGAPERRIVSTAWEIGIVGAGAIGLLTYIGTADHRFGHPLHWVLAAVGILLGYAIGIGAVTPRVRLQAPSHRS